MNKDVAKYMEMMQTDTALQERIKEAAKNYTGEYKDEDVWNDVIGKIVEEEGFSFTFDDYKKYINDNSELSQDELLNVAGGRWGFCVIIGGSDGGAASASWCGAGACYYVGIGFAFLDPDRDVRDGRVQ